MNFKTILAGVYGFLGVSAFGKDAEGKSLLSKDQETLLEEKYGKKFLESFKEDLKKLEADGSSAESTVTEEVKADLEKEKEKGAKELKQAQERIANLEKENKQYEAQIELLGRNAAEDKGVVVDNANGSAMNRKFKPDMSLGFNQHINSVLNGKGAVVSGNDTIDTEQLHKEFGRYVSSEKFEIFKSLVGTTDSLQYMQTMITDKFEVRATHSHITSVLQSFIPKWTPKGKSAFTPLTIKQYPMKINVEIVPAEVIDECIGYLYDESLDPADMPIVKYIIEQLVKPKLDEEREYAFALGRHKDPTANADGGYTASEANDVCDGYLTQLCDIKRGGNTQGVNFLLDGKTLGTGAQLVTDIEKAVDEVKVNYKNKKMFIHCDPDIVLNYSRAYRDKYPNSKNQDGEKITVDYTNCVFGPIEGMRGTGAFFITPKENFRHLMSREPRDQKLRMQTADYTAKVFGEWREGVGFWLAEAIFAYIPDSLLNKLSPAGEQPSGL